ncbi:MAG: phosphotransferase family protein [Mycobacterium sp.]|nr:MAG: phosphotransferase family protein [Mycobacterium sp.]
MLDTDKLSRWMRDAGLGEGPIEEAVQLTGGTQNILVRFRYAGRDLVLRRPSLRAPSNRNALILREAKVLHALRDTSVPHARLVAACADEEVLGGAVFYIMDAVDGFNPAEELPAGLSDYRARERMSMDATDALAAIGALDYVAIGLDGFGKPEGFLERQVARWVGERDSYLAMDNYDGAPLPGFASIRDYLAENVPRSYRVGLIHGDYHFGNLLFDRESADMVAVLDWEMSTIGDPLMDFGRYLAMWPDEHEVIIDTGAIWGSGPLPTCETLIERYVQKSGADTEYLHWYILMGCFKLGIILEGTYARSCAGLAPEHVGKLLHDTAVRLFDRGCRLIGAAP